MSYSFARHQLLRQQFDENRRQLKNHPITSTAASQPTLIRRPTYEQVISVENLRTSLELLHSVGGYKAGGPDGVCYADLSKSDIWHIARELHVALANGTWEPSVARRVRIPKDNDEFRTLLIRSIATQGVAKTLDRLLSPYWDQFYLRTSYGFRAGCGINDLLIELERRIVQGNAWCLVQDDVRRAFDNLRIYVALEDHARHITDPRLLRLIGQLLTGHPSEQRQVGTDSGSSYSPTNLNTYLHFHLDLPLETEETIPGLLRYADNVIVRSRSVSEGQETMGRAAALLESVGLKLKGEDPAVDLHQGEKANVLGIQIGAENGQLQYQLSEKAWQGLRELLREAQEMEYPARSARHAIQGWIEAYGPAFAEARRQPLVERILGAAAEHGIVEISSSRVSAAIQAAGDRWVQLRKDHGLSVGG